MVYIDSSSARDIRISNYFLQNTAHLICTSTADLHHPFWLTWCGVRTQLWGQEIWRYSASWHCTGSRYSVGVVIREMLERHESHLGRRILQYTL